MYDFLTGAIMIGSLVASLLFWRFWQRTMDRIFLWFALAFALMGVERLVLTLMHANEVSSPSTYTIRLIAFLMIAAAIVDKNRR